MRQSCPSSLLWLPLAASKRCRHGQAPDANDQTRQRSVWLKPAKYGVFVHFLPSGPDYQKNVDAFDTESFADQMECAGAAYVFFTLGQNSGYYCSPNKTYEAYVGCGANERCAKRDLPMDLADALAKRKIRLMLYLPSRAPQQDPVAMSALSDVGERQPAPQEFTRKWSEVIREWSERYGKKVSGWWFDGAYNTAGWDNLQQSRNWQTWSAACRAGNSESLLAFNPGTDPRAAFSALSAQQDYTAGESNDWTATPRNHPAPRNVQWHVLGFLGSNWGKADGPRRSSTEMANYVKSVNEQGGVVTLDVHVSSRGEVFVPHLNQLIAIKVAVRGK